MTRALAGFVALTAVVLAFAVENGENSASNAIAVVAVIFWIWVVFRRR
jgi:hypothetical protein